MFRSRQYRKANPDKILTNNRRFIPLWRKAHPVASASISRKAKEARRARLNNVLNDFTAEQWHEILQTFSHSCAYCLASNVPLEQDHMQPISRGGEHTASNIVPACVGCNRRKSTKSFLAFVASEHRQPLRFAA